MNEKEVSKVTVSSWCFWYYCHHMGLRREEGLGRMDVGHVLDKQVAVSHRIELRFQDLMERTAHKHPSTFHRRVRRLQRAKTQEKLIWTNSPRT